MRAPTSAAPSAGSLPKETDAAPECTPATHPCVRDGWAPPSTTDARQNRTGNSIRPSREQVNGNMLTFRLPAVAAVSRSETANDGIGRPESGAEQGLVDRAGDIRADQGPADSRR